MSNNTAAISRNLDTVGVMIRGDLCDKQDISMPVGSKLVSGSSSPLGSAPSIDKSRTGSSTIVNSIKNFFKSDTNVTTSIQSAPLVQGCANTKPVTTLSETASKYISQQFSSNTTGPNISQADRSRLIRQPTISNQITYSLLHNNNNDSDTESDVSDDDDDDDDESSTTSPSSPTHTPSNTVTTTTSTPKTIETMFGNIPVPTKTNYNKPTKGKFVFNTDNQHLSNRIHNNDKIHLNFKHNNYQKTNNVNEYTKAIIQKQLQNHKNEEERSSDDNIHHISYIDIHNDNTVIPESLCELIDLDVPITFENEMLGDYIALPRHLANHHIVATRYGWRFVDSNSAIATAYTFEHSYSQITITQNFIIYHVVSNFDNPYKPPIYYNYVNTSGERGQSCFTDESVSIYMAKITMADSEVIASKRVVAMYNRNADQDVDYIVTQFLAHMATKLFQTRDPTIANKLEIENKFHDQYKDCQTYPYHAKRGTCCGIKECTIDSVCGCTNYKTSQCDPNTLPIMGAVLEDCNHEKVWLNTDCEHAAYSAVTNRVLRETIKPKSSAIKRFADFIDYSWDYVFQGQTPERWQTNREWFYHLKPSQQRNVLSKMKQIAGSNNLDRQQLVVSAFIKREKFYKPDFTPRLISSPSATVHYRSGPIIYTMEKFIKNIYSYKQRSSNINNFKNVTYASGYDRTQIGDWMRWCIEDLGMRNPVVIGMDYSKFDAHESPSLLAAERYIYRRLADKLDPDLIDTAIADEMFTEGKCVYKNRVFKQKCSEIWSTWIKTFGNKVCSMPSDIIKTIVGMFDGHFNEKYINQFKYITDLQALLYKLYGQETVDEGVFKYIYDARRDSGRTSTAASNFELSDKAIMYCLAQQIDIFGDDKDKWAMLGCGDDSNTMIDGVHIDIKKLQSDMESLGLKAKVTVRSLRDTVFCSSYFIPCHINGKLTYNLTQVPTANMSKAYVTVNPDMTPKQDLQWIKQNSDMYARNFNHIKPLRDWHKRINRKYLQTHERVKMPKSMDRDMSYLNSTITPKPCPETDMWFKSHYNLSDEQYQQLHSILSSSRINWNHEIIEQLYYIDNLYSDDYIDKDCLHRLNNWPKSKPTDFPETDTHKEFLIPRKVIKNIPIDEINVDADDVEHVDDGPEQHPVLDDGFTHLDFNYARSNLLGDSELEFRNRRRLWKFNRDQTRQTKTCWYGARCKRPHCPFRHDQTSNWFSDSDDDDYSDGNDSLLNFKYPKLKQHRHHNNNKNNNPDSDDKDDEETLSPTELFQRHEREKRYQYKNWLRSQKHNVQVVAARIKLREDLMRAKRAARRQRINSNLNTKQKRADTRGITLTQPKPKTDKSKTNNNQKHKTQMKNNNKRCEAGLKPPVTSNKNTLLIKPT